MGIALFEPARKSHCLLISNFRVYANLLEKLETQQLWKLTCFMQLKHLIKKKV